MHTTWKFSSLAALADHLENKAHNTRESIDQAKPKSLRNIEKRAQAAELESLAHVLRNCTIGE